MYRSLYIDSQMTGTLWQQPLQQLHLVSMVWWFAIINGDGYTVWDEKEQVRRQKRVQIPASRAFFSEN